MIIIKIKGGLGNQLFQYAFARSLSYNLDTELFLDLSYFTHFEKRKHVVFGLNSFNINGIIGNYPYIEKTSIGINYDKKHVLTKYDEGDFPDKVYEYDMINNTHNIKLPAFLEGYFQYQIKNKQTCLMTENFFKNDNELIHEDFEYIKPLSNNSQVLIEEMKNYDSIALHIRHGDYEKIPNFGLCSLEYYQNAIDILSKNLNNPKFYIFTEDPNWAKLNLKFNVPYKIIIFNESKNAVGRAYGELLKVMASCKHFIIANSTFSWWGAFLSKNKYKIIISPKPWFQNRMIIGCDTIDNVKTIDLDNNYKKIYQNSDNELYELNNNFIYKNVEIESSDALTMFNLNINSKLIINDFNKTRNNSGIIIKISMKSNCFNCLKIFYKNETDDYCEKNSRTLYYYENDDFTHYILIRNTEKINEIMIKPHIINTSNDDEYIQIKSLKIREL